MKPADFIFLFGFVGAICTLFALFYTWRQNINSSNRAIQTLTNTDSLLQENRLLKEQVESQSNKIDSLRSENNELSSKLMGKSLDIYNNLTGGEGNKPIIVLQSTPLISDDPSKIKYYMLQFIVKNNGKYPLKNLSVKLVDNMGRDMIQFGVKHSVIDELTYEYGVRDKVAEFKNYEFVKRFTLGTLTPKTPRIFYRTTYSPEVQPQPPYYNISVNWDNGNFLHIVTLKQDNKEHLCLDSVETLFNGVEFSSKNFFKFGSD